MTRKVNKEVSDKLAAIYVRVSTVVQTDGISLERQEQECRDEARSAGFKVVKVYRDVMSGRRDDRPGFSEMLEAGRKGEFSRVYVWTVDRFGRSFRAAVNAVTDLRDEGVATIAVREGDLRDDIRLGVLSAVASREIERIRERTLPAKLAKRDKGYFVSGREPFGYRKRPDKSLEKCPVESRIVRRIFDDSLAGLGRVAIARRLNRGAAVPLEARVWLPGMAKGKARRVRVGQLLGLDGNSGFVSWVEANGGEVIGLPRWHSRGVARVLENSAACGFLTIKGEDGATRRVQLKIEGGPIVTPTEFDAAASARRRRFRKSGRRPQEPWLLTGKLICGSCGKHYLHHEGKRRRKPHPEGERDHYYACNSRRSGKGCQSPHLRMMKTDEEVIHAIRRHFGRHFDSEALTRLLDNQSRKDRAELAAEIDGLEQERLDAKQKWKMTEALLQAALTRGAMASDVPGMVENNRTAARRYEALGESIGAAQAELAILDAGMTAKAGEVADVTRRIEDALNLIVSDDQGTEPTADLFAVVNAMVERVMVNPDRTVKVELASDVRAWRRVFAGLSATALDDLRLETSVINWSREAARRGAAK